MRDTFHDDFDRLTVSELRRRNGIKWGTTHPDVLAAWVADMDFAAPPVVLEALQGLVAAGELGYPAWSDGPTPLRGLFAARMDDLYGWNAEADHVREFDDLIHALRVVLDLGTQPGQAVAVHTPGYTPFIETLPYGGRTLLPIPLVDSGEAWTFDLERLDRNIAESRCAALLVVNPQNPTGRVLTETELVGLADIARRHDLLVISDEIHAELVYAPNRHVPFASLSADAAGRTVTLASATKAFNIAGTCIAVAHVGPERLRAELDSRPEGFLGARNMFGVAATTAAWESGDPWREQLLRYLDGNRQRVTEFLAEKAPEVGYHQPEATYLGWLDFRRTGIADDPAARLLDAGVRLVDGRTTGPGGSGFARLNFATSRQVLDAILNRIAAAL